MISKASYDPTLDPVPPPAVVLRSLGLLALSGASLALALQLVSMRGQLAAFLSANSLGKHDRSLLVGSIAVGALVPLLFAGVLLLVRRRQGVAWIDPWARLLSPVAVAAFVPALFTPAWSSQTLKFLCTLSVAVVLFTRTAELSFAAAEEVGGRLPRWIRFVVRALGAPFRILDRPRVAFVVAALAGVAYAVYTTHLTVLNLHRLTMGSYDMGFFDNQMANSLAGRFFRNTLMYGPAGGNSIAGHAHFAHLLFLPLYAIAPSSELLLGLQAAGVGLATIPLFLFASTQISPRASVAVCLAYLLFAPLHGAQFYDFHWLLLGPFAFFWLAYGIVKGRTWLVAGTTLFVLLLREDMSPGIAILGLFLLLTRARPRLGAILMVTGTVWFGVVKFVIMPAAGTWWFENIYKDLLPPGEVGYGPILKTLVANPAFAFTTLLTETKVVYLLHLFAPLAFLPLRRPALALLAMPALLLTVLTTGYSAATSIYFQYPGHWVTYLFTSTVLAIRVVKDSSGVVAARAAVAALCLAMLAHSVVFGVVFLPREFKGAGGKVALSLTPEETRHYEDVKALVRLIPPKASVIATESQVPLISNRPDAFSAALHEADAEYVLVHRDHYLLKAKENLRALLRKHQFGLVEQRGAAALFKKGPASPTPSAVLRAAGLE